jgi:hypothetical protein
MLSDQFRVLGGSEKAIFSSGTFWTPQFQISSQFFFHSIFSTLIFFSGVQCESICERGKFGADCQNYCDCEHGSSCEPQSGKKHSVARWLIFIPKNPNLGIFWTASEWKFLCIILPFAIYYGHLVNFTSIWNVFVVNWYIFGMFFKSDNPAASAHCCTIGSLTGY